MKIFFTKKEYRLLIDMISLSDWVMNSHHLASEKINADYDVLYQKVLSYAKEMQAEDIVEYAKNLDGYFPTSKHEENLHDKYIEPYEQDVFWEQLIDCLAQRDFLKKVGAEKFKSMDWIERASATDEIEQEYSMEFENNGITNLVLQKDT